MEIKRKILLHLCVSIVGLLLLTFCFSIPAKAAESENGEWDIKVVSFNLKFELAHYNELHHNGGHPVDKRKGMTANMVNSYKPDIFGTCEETKSFRNYLPKATGYGYYGEPLNSYSALQQEFSNSSQPQADRVYYNKERFEGIYGVTIWLHDGDVYKKGKFKEEDVYRGAAVAVLKDKKSNKKIIAAMTHLGLNGENADRESAVLLNFVKNMKDKYGADQFVIMGDMNYSSYFKKNGELINVYESGAKNLNSSTDMTTWHDWGKLKDRAPLDYVFLEKKEGSCYKFINFQILNSAVWGDALKASDHYPLFATLRFSHEHKLNTITFNANGGKGTMDNQVFKEGETVVLNANAFTREGYTFEGWSQAVDGSVGYYEDKGSYSSSFFSGDTVLYAQWKEDSYTVTWDAAGGTINGKTTDTTVYTGGKKLKEIPIAGVPTRDGYTFEGWKSADNYSVPFSDTQNHNVTVNKEANAWDQNWGDYHPKGNFTMQAQWKEIKSYTITFNANGGKGTMDNQVFKEGETVVLNANAFTREGYTFDGWSQAVDGSVGYYADKGSYSSLFFSGDTVLYAQWKKNATGDDVIPQPDDNKPEVPDNYVKVDFADGDHGKITEGVKIYWVNPEKEVTVPAPTVTADKDYTHTGWDTPLTGTFKAATTITAEYKKDAADAAYVKIDPAGNYQMHSDGHAIFWLENADGKTLNVPYTLFNDAECKNRATSDAEVKWSVEMAGGFDNNAFSGAKTTLLPEDKRSPKWEASKSTDANEGNNIRLNSAKSGIYKVTVSAGDNGTDYCYVVVPGDLNRDAEIQANDV
ncbi:InlB B-repeat-containing protein, partial [Enterococcus durans]|uniref:InlB B-repeat-containing protein n=1 Tax=Enterococcus durans TaxID=53345 RepID=UPI001D0BBE43